MAQTAEYIARHARLLELFNAYNTAQNNYNSALSENNQGHVNQQNGELNNVFVFPYSGAQTDRGSFYNWLAQSDAALSNYKINRDTAKQTYDSYKADVDTLDQAEFIANNPTLAPQLAEIAATAQTNAAIGIAQATASQTASEIKAKGELAAAEQEAKTKKTVTIVIVIVVIGITIFGVYKLYKKYSK